MICVFGFFVSVVRGVGLQSFSKGFGVRLGRFRAKALFALSKTGEQPHLFGVEPPRPRLEAVRVVDMSASNSWAELATVFRRTRPAFHEHEGAKADLKKLVPEDAKEAVGHGVRAKRSKAGAVSFDIMEMEATDALLQ